MKISKEGRERERWYFIEDRCGCFASRYEHFEVNRMSLGGINVFDNTLRKYLFPVDSNFIVFSLIF